MTRKDVINHWREKSDSALEAAQLTLQGGYLDTTVNRIYYALFYEVTALLLTKDLSFKTHKGLRSAFHNNFIRTNELDVEMGEFYNEMYDRRFTGDYSAIIDFKTKDVQEWLEQAEEFIDKIEVIIQEEM